MNKRKKKKKFPISIQKFLFFFSVSKWGSDKSLVIYNFHISSFEIFGELIDLLNASSWCIWNDVGVESKRRWIIASRFHTKISCQSTTINMFYIIFFQKFEEISIHLIFKARIRISLFSGTFQNNMIATNFFFIERK